MPDRDSSHNQQSRRPSTPSDSDPDATLPMPDGDPDATLRMPESDPGETLRMPESDPGATLPMPGRRDELKTMVTDLSPKGQGERPQSRAPTMVTQPGATGSAPPDLAKTIKTPPPQDPGTAMTMAGSPGYGSDVTMATGAPGSVAPGGGADPVPGEVWGDYQFEKLLGRGGMGSVFRGRQVSLDRLVAIKILPRHLSQNPDFRKRFVLEARAVAQISSPNVIQVYAAGEHQGNSYFAMEYVAGQDLSELMKSGYKPAPQEALELVLQAAKGLAAAGDLDIVHRDIKPSNMMVTDDKQLKLMDFGLVKLTRQSSSITMTGTVMGTVTYFSPEQGRGETCDQRTDIYALGVVFYEVLTGLLPFTGDDPSAIIYQHLHAEPKLPREINPSIPESYQAIVLKCMQKNQADRYQDAHELIRDLEAVRGGRDPKTAMIDPRTLRTGATIGKTTQFSVERKRQNRSLAIIALLVVAVVGGGGFYAVQSGLIQLGGQPAAADSSSPAVTRSPVTASDHEGPTADPATNSTDPTPANNIQPVVPAAAESDLDRAERLLASGQLEEVARLVEMAALQSDNQAAWQQLAVRLQAAQAEHQIALIRQALATEDVVTAQSKLEQLKEISEEHPALATLMSQLEELTRIHDAVDLAEVQLRAGDTGEALQTIEDLRAGSLSVAKRRVVEQLAADARYLEQMLQAGEDGLQRMDLDTARQCFSDAFNRYENRAARAGIALVSLSTQFEANLQSGSLAEAQENLRELKNAGASQAVLDARGKDFEIAQQATDLRRAIQAHDFETARAALKKLRSVDPEGRQVAELAHAIDLEQLLLAFGRSLEARDLEAAQQNLEAIRAHDGEREAWRNAKNTLVASRLAEEAEAERIAELAEVAGSLIGAQTPDWPSIEQAIDRVAGEAGADAAIVTDLRAQAADRRLTIELSRQLQALDAAVLAGERAVVGQIVRDQEHVGVINFFVGREALVFSHELVELKRGNGATTTVVKLTAGSKAYPESTVTSHYHWQLDADVWVVADSELQNNP